MPAKDSMLKTIIITMSMVAAMLAATSVRGGESGLDKEKLKSGLAERIETMSRRQAGEKSMKITAENVRIKRVEPTSLEIDGSVIQLYAVKAGLEIPGGQTSDIMLVVDESAGFQFSVQKVDSGQSLFQAAEDRIQKRQFDSDVGHTLYSGSGQHELVLASSPFCPYCTDAFNFFKKNRDRLSEWRILHMSYEQQPAASAAVWAMMDGTEAVSELELMEFGYTELEPVEGTPEEQTEGVIGQFMEEFPELADKWGTPEQAKYYLKGKYAEQAAEEARYIRSRLQVRATPTAYIDGVPVEGLAPARYESLLGGGKEGKEKET